eukprot:360633-Chlamydomonas_euryale.AAC.3
MQQTANVPWFNGTEAALAPYLSPACKSDARRTCTRIRMPCMQAVVAGCMAHRHPHPHAYAMHAGGRGGLHGAHQSMHSAPATARVIGTHAARTGALYACVHMVPHGLTAYPHGRADRMGAWAHIASHGLQALTGCLHGSPDCLRAGLHGRPDCIRVNRPTQPSTAPRAPTASLPLPLPPHTRHHAAAAARRFYPNLT